MSGNETQFTTQEFFDFCRERGIEHLLTAPFHPQSNGQVERFVDTFKRARKKQNSLNFINGIRDFLHVYRATNYDNAFEKKSPSIIYKYIHYF